MRTKNMERMRAMIEFNPDVDQEADMKRVMAYTNELVELALKADWLAVLEGIDARRTLLQAIIDRDPEGLNQQIIALSDAVAESERALMRVVAHAIAGSRMNGGKFAIYH